MDNFEDVCMNIINNRHKFNDRDKNFRTFRRRTSKIPGSMKTVI